MKTKNVRLKFGKGKDVSTVIWTGDWHLGNESVDLDSLDCLQDRILSNSNIQVIHGSDIIEGIIPTDKRFDVDEAETTVVEQIEMAVSRLKAIAKQCVGMLKGNHESAPSRLIGDITALMCKQADIDNLSQCCYLNVDAPDGNSTAFCSHFVPSINNRNEDAVCRQAAKASRLRKLLRPFEAHLKLLGHIHHFICHTPVLEDRLMFVENKIKHRPVMVRPEWIAVCPAFLKVYGDQDNYAQAKLYDPTDIGWVEVDFDKQAQVVEIRNVLGDGTTKRKYHAELVD